MLLAFHFYSQLENTSLGGQYSVIYGFLTFWALPMAVIYELNGFLGMSAVGLFLFAGLTWLWKSQQDRTMLIKS
ncbi:MAG: hypothetical protein J7L88_01170 [Thermoplasmata archaeon]|nr:hypothetical protein [Thermoplasmata archaeon]